MVEFAGKRKEDREESVADVRAAASVSLAKRSKSTDTELAEVSTEATKARKKKKEKAPRSVAEPASKKVKSDSELESPGDTASKVAPVAPELYLKNPATMPTSRSGTNPVLTINKMLLGEHSILIDDGNDATAAGVLKTTVAAAIVDKFHSADFQKLTIDQLGKDKLKIHKSVSAKMSNQIVTCIDEAVACVDAFESGRLISSKKHVQALKVAEAAKTDLLQQLAAAQKEIHDLRSDAMKAIDNALGTIADEIEQEDQGSGMTTADILKRIAGHRAHFNNQIEYSALTVSSDLPPLKEMENVTKYAVSPEKHQRNYDKFAAKINEMSSDTAAVKLERLHQKMISSSFLIVSAGKTPPTCDEIVDLRHSACGHDNEKSTRSTSCIVVYL